MKTQLFISLIFFYADGIVFIGDWNELNIATFMWVLHCFQLVYGLKINVHKSKNFGIGVPVREIEEVPDLIRCVIMKLPFPYLGLVMGGNMSKLYTWWDLADKLCLNFPIGR